MVVTVAMGVFYRYAIGQSLYWVPEVPKFLLIWMVSLGSVVAFHEKKHIAFTVLADALGEAAGRWLEIIAALIVLVFLFALVWFGYDLVRVTMGSPSEALKIPRGYIYSCLPLAAALMAVSAIGHIWQNLRAMLR